MSKSKLFDDLDIEDTIDNAIDWLKALCESRHSQGFEEMVSDVGTPFEARCCLGVGRHTSGSASNIPSNTIMADSFTGYVSEQRAVGLRDWDGEGRTAGHFSLIYLNDDEQLTHPQIGLHLVKYPDQYFIPAVAEAVKEYFWTGEGKKDWKTR